MGMLLGAEYTDFIMKNKAEEIFSRFEVLCLVKTNENPSQMIAHGSEAKQKIRNATNFVYRWIVHAKEVVTKIAETTAQINLQKQLNEEESKQQQRITAEVLFSAFSEYLDNTNA